MLSAVAIEVPPNFETMSICLATFLKKNKNTSLADWCFVS
jgi:hypothetical protein